MADKSPIRVKATFANPKQYGFYDTKRRYDGDEFDINPDHFSEKWMVKVDAKAAPKEAEVVEIDKPARGKK
jgi:hypothetical protein